MSKAENVVASVGDKLGDKALQYLEQFEKAAAQYSPEVVDTALTVIQISSAVNIFYGLIGTGLVFAGYKCVRAGRKTMPDDDDVGCGLMAIGAMTGIVGFFMAASWLFDIWNWIGLIEPKLWIAKELFSKLL